MLPPNLKKYTCLSIVSVYADCLYSPSLMYSLIFLSFLIFTTLHPPLYHLLVFLLPFCLSACLPIRLLSCMLLYFCVMSSDPSLSGSFGVVQKVRIHRVTDKDGDHR